MCHSNYSMFVDAEPILPLRFAVIRASVPKLELDAVFEQKNDIAKAVEEELEKVNLTAYEFNLLHSFEFCLTCSAFAISAGYVCLWLSDCPDSDC